MKMKSKFRYLLLLIAAISILLCGCGKQIVLASGFRADELFRIDKISCTDKEFMVYLANTQNQYSSAFGEEIWNQSIGGKSLKDDVVQTVLARVVKIKMMNLMAESNGIALTEEEVQVAKQCGEAYYAMLSESDKEALLNITEKDIQQMYIEYALAEKVYETYTSQINFEISDEQARSISLKQIWIPYVTNVEKAEAAQKAEEAYQKLENGDSFDVVAAEYNQAESLEIIVRKGDFSGGLENAAFNLSDGTYSKVLESKDGYYIFYCMSAFNAADAEATRQQLQEENRKQSFHSVYEMFSSEKKCYLNDELWETLDLSRVNQIKTTDFLDIYRVNFGK